MRCLDCNQDIIQSNPEMCPYCHSKNLISDEKYEDLEKEKSLKEIAKLDKAGQYEEAAVIYDRLEMPAEAEACRRKDMAIHGAVAKISSINMKCPHCGASQPLTSKEAKVTCASCNKKYMVPQKVLDLL